MDDAQQKMLEALATKLGTTAEYLWKVQVSWMQTQATTDCIVLGILVPLYVIAFIVACKLARHAYSRRVGYLLRLSRPRADLSGYPAVVPDQRGAALLAQP